MKSALKKSLIIGLLATFGFLSFGFVESYFELSKNLDIFSSVYREINVKYVEETNPGKLVKTGIDAMLASLDPYTNYIAEADIEDYKFIGGTGSAIVVVNDPHLHTPNVEINHNMFQYNGQPGISEKTLKSGEEAIPGPASVELFKFNRKFKLKTEMLNLNLRLNLLSFILLVVLFHFSSTF